jgi:predicted membrane-bound spermidine synthase
MFLTANNAIKTAPIRYKKQYKDILASPKLIYYDVQVILSVFSPLSCANCHIIFRLTQNMLLYWGMFTVGFFFGVFLTYRLFVENRSEKNELKEEKSVLNNQTETPRYIPSTNTK